MALVLKSAAAPMPPPGSFIHNNGSVKRSGTVKVEKFISKYLTQNDAKLSYDSSPVCYSEYSTRIRKWSSLKIVTDIYRWDEPLAQWVNSKTATGLWNTSFQAGWRPYLNQARMPAISTAYARMWPRNFFRDHQYSEPERTSELHYRRLCRI